jgi:hypothetical protein
MDNLSNEKLLFDRQESFNDVIACLAAISQGIPGYEDRLEGNLDIINKIHKECKDRGFDPAQFDQVQNILKGG